MICLHVRLQLCQFLGATVPEKWSPCFRQIVQRLEQGCNTVLWGFSPAGMCVVQARGFFRLDSIRSVRVWELLCANGWLRGTNPEEAEDKRRLKRKGVAGAVAGAALAGQRQDDAADAAEREGFAADGDDAAADREDVLAAVDSEAVSGAAGAVGVDSPAVVGR